MWSGLWPCSLPASSIPKGLCNSAQGCEERATLGKATDDSQPQRGCGMVLFPWASVTTLSGLSPMWRAFSQGSSFLATLGFVAESLWDSALGATHSKMRVTSRANRTHSKRLATKHAGEHTRASVWNAGLSALSLILTGPP